MRRKHIPISESPHRTHCERLSAFARIAHETEHGGPRICRLCSYVQSVIDANAEQDELRRKRTEHALRLADETLSRSEDSS